MLTKEVDQVKDDNTWSSLPNLLLWTIKARLDYPNSVRFALVCKHWLHASMSSPLKDENEVENSPPWIMYLKEKRVDSRREFVSLLTEERYTIKSLDFSGSEVLYSKQGWLLLIKERHSKAGLATGAVATNCNSPYMLFNPFKNVKIELPFLNIVLKRGAFTIKDGNPDCIALATYKITEDSHNAVTLYITHPGGNNAWHRYSYTPCDERICEFVRWVFIIGKSVCLITSRGGVFVFNYSNLQWTELSRKLSKGWYLMVMGIQYMVEKQGEIFFLNFLGRKSDAEKELANASFYKLNLGEKVYWEPIDAHVMSQGCLWFLTDVLGNRSFAWKTSEVQALDKFGKFVNNTWVQFRSSENLKLVHMC